jgi:type III restriction enzyme
LDNFHSIYEKRLIKFVRSQQLVIKDKINNEENLSRVEQEYEELLPNMKNH